MINFEDEFKKKIIAILVLAAISLSLVSTLSPVFTMSTEDSLKDAGYENVDYYQDCSFYFFFSYYATYDNRNLFSNDDTLVDSYIVVFYLFDYHPVVAEKSSEMKDPYYELLNEKNRTFAFIKGINDVLMLFFCFFLGFLYLYFCYKNFKNIGVKTRYPLYSSFIGFLFLGGFYFGTNSFLSIYSPLFPKYIVLGYSFYYILIASLLFLIVYVLQNYFDHSKKDVIINNLSKNKD